jgi:hypothetical protein
MAKLPNYIDSLPYNIESLVGMIVQYSPDIEWDWSSGEYPKGTEDVFKWSSTFQPIKWTNGEFVNYHVWMRFKFNGAGIWSVPVRFIGEKGDKGNMGKDGENTLEKLIAIAPLHFNLATNTLTHSSTEGFSHIPVGGTNGQFLQKIGSNSYGWATVSVDLSNYLQGGQVDNVSELINDANYISVATTPQEDDILQFDGTDWISTPFDTSSKEWTVHFPTTYLPIGIATDADIRIDSVVLHNVDEVEIAVGNNGYDPLIPPKYILANTIFRIRVTSFTVPIYDGVIQIKATKQ